MLDYCQNKDFDQSIDSEFSWGTPYLSNFLVANTQKDSCCMSPRKMIHKMKKDVKPKTLFWDFVQGACLVNKSLI